MSAKQPDAADSINTSTLQDFLENVVNRKWFHVYFMASDEEKSRPRGYVAQDIPAIIRRIKTEINHKNNVFLGLNVPSHTQRKKALKSEIELHYGYVVDIDLVGMRRDDPAAETALDDLFALLDNLPNIFPRDPLIISTGNGAQVVWFLAVPQTSTPDSRQALETVNARLIEAFKQYLSDPRFKVDSVFNVDRIIRMPETVNWPTALKRSRGCTARVAEIYAWPGADVKPADFDRLPRIAPPRYRETPDRVDYAALPLTSLTRPYTADDFLGEYPDFDARIKHTLDATGGDRSRGVWRILMEVCDFIERQERIGPGEIAADVELKTNISLICWELCERGEHIDHAMQHIRDSAHGAAQLGYELNRTIMDRLDAGLCGSTPKAAGKAAKRQEIARASVTTSACADATIADCADATSSACAGMSVETATLAFLTHMQTCIARDRLPNVVNSGDQAALIQGTTLANVRAILSAAGIRTRWDAMRDTVDFEIDPEIRTAGGAPIRPALNFARACSAAPLDLRPHVQMHLILDGLFELGLRDRTGAGAHIETLARENPFHPLETYCKAVPWDGRDRFSDVADCLETVHPLKTLYMRLFFRATVGAIMSLWTYGQTHEGQELSTSIVLIGAQGIGKSRFWRKLVPAGFLATGTALGIGRHGEADSKKACLGGVVCCLNELGQTQKRSEADSLKDFLSSTVDQYRTAFGRFPIVKPRMTVFVGTANNDFMLTDSTGDRRWLCMQISGIDHERLARIDLQQLYAQAWHEVVVERQNWWLTPEADAQRAALNAELRDEGEEAGCVRDYLCNLPVATEIRWVTATQIAKLFDFRYKSWSWHRVRNVLDAFGIEYRGELYTKAGPRLQKVYGMPLSAELYARMLVPGR